MSGRRRGGSGRGLKHSSVAALVTLGCCLLSAPTANADFDDLIDTVLAAATTGPDPADLAGIPGGFGDFDVNSVLDDPLAQLDQVLHGAPGQLGLGEPESAPADTTHDPDTPPDTTHDSGTTPGTTPGAGSGATTGSEHGTSSGSSGNSPSLPKFSMPSSGSGGGGNGGGGSGGSGGSGNGATKSKANAGASKSSATPPATPQPEVP